MNLQTVHQRLVLHVSPEHGEICVNMTVLLQIAIVFLQRALFKMEAFLHVPVVETVTMDLLVKTNVPYHPVVLPQRVILPPVKLLLVLHVCPGNGELYVIMVVILQIANVLHQLVQTMMEVSMNAPAVKTVSMGKMVVSLNVLFHRVVLLRVVIYRMAQMSLVHNVFQVVGDPIVNVTTFALTQMLNAKRQLALLTEPLWNVQNVKMAFGEILVQIHAIFHQLVMKVHVI
jgi:hypothetical protein